METVEKGTPPESLRLLAHEIDASPIPVFVCDVEDERILLMNSAAADLFGVPASALLGTPASGLWDGSWARGSTNAISALMTGAVDSYRAHRTIATPDGSVGVSVWARTLETDEAAVAVTVVLPNADAGLAGTLIETYFAPEAANLVVGTIDGQGRFTEVTPNSEAVIGLTPEEVAGSQLMDLVHPEDIDRLIRALRQAAATTREAAVDVRLRHPDRGWTDVRCLTLSTPPDQPVRVALAPTGPAGGLPTLPNLADLERQVLRLAAELRAVTMRQHSPMPAEVTRVAALDALPLRQREIVERLLRGDRVPTIATSLYLSPSTVRNHLSHAFKSFGVGSQAELLSLLRSELADTPDR